MPSSDKTQNLRAARISEQTYQSEIRDKFGTENGNQYWTKRTTDHKCCM